MESAAPDVIQRLVTAMNDHDPEGVAACMTSDYRSETPTHPERNFTGREQVRQNWEAAFESTPDLQADVSRLSVDGDTVWTEWQIQGTQTDGSELDLRGVAIWQIEDDLLQAGRIYLEQVQSAPDVSWEEFYGVDGAEGRDR